MDDQPWRIAELADAVADALADEAARADREQAVYGLDAHDELGLHPLIRDALTAAGWGAWPEQRYPGHWHKKSQAEGLRCDLVLTRDRQPLRDPQLKTTLWDQQPAEDAETAYWLEIKTVAQFESAGPFPRYASELLSTVAHDVKKLYNDRVIMHGGLLLVLFTRDQAVAEHDLASWHHRCLERGYPVGVPAIRGFPIADRLGNAWCAVALFQVRGSA